MVLDKFISTFLVILNVLITKTKNYDKSQYEMKSEKWNSTSMKRTDQKINNDLLDHK
jgi:hypothetical protein